MPFPLQGGQGPGNHRYPGQGTQDRYRCVTNSNNWGTTNGHSSNILGTEEPVNQTGAEGLTLGTREETESGS